jgi:diaminohydroxyphosphoribosylaminopyrimidine deaminase/5-amino-6-(5-phosphoribosylamino)uracil reductase
MTELLSAGGRAPDGADAALMHQALELAERGLYTTDPNPRVGCVLVRDGVVVGTGFHARAGEPHAEVMALRAAGDAARGATAYVTLEPCSHTGRTPPCADALIGAGIARVHCATVDPNPRVAGAGIARLEAQGIPVSVGLLASEARALNAGFFSRFERQRPYVRLKLAMSLDGRTARADGRRAWITGEAARADVQHWRARSSAVLTGAGTVRSDDPRLDVRLHYGPWVRQPLRVVLDPAGSCLPTARVFQGEASLWFTAAVRTSAARDDVSTPDSVAHAGAAPAAPAAVVAGQPLLDYAPRAPGGLDLPTVLRKLALAHECNELLVECGPRLAGAFLRAELVDELVLYVAPSFLGSDAPPLAHWPFTEAQRTAFDFHDVRRIGEDVRLILVSRRS